MPVRRPEWARWRHDDVGTHIPFSCVGKSLMIKEDSWDGYRRGIEHPPHRGGNCIRDADWRILALALMARNPTGRLEPRGVAPRLPACARPNRSAQAPSSFEATLRIAPQDEGSTSQPRYQSHFICEHPPLDGEGRHAPGWGDFLRHPMVHPHPQLRCDLPHQER
jgi:hypothetical protein